MGTARVGGMALLLLALAVTFTPQRALAGRPPTAGGMVSVGLLQDPATTDTLAIFSRPPEGAGPARTIPRLDGLPQWTFRYLLPESLVGLTPADSGCRAVSLLWDRLREAGYADPVILTAAPRSILIVCPPEHINPRNGRRTKPQFTLNATPPSLLRPLDLFSRVFSPHRDYYRILVLAIGPARLADGAPATSADSLMALRLRGAAAFRESWCRMAAAHPSCEAVVYEFSRTGAHDTPTFVSRSDLPLAAHLSGTQLWKKEDLHGLEQ